MPAAASPLNAAAYPARMEPVSAPSPLRELTHGLARGDDAAWTKFHRDYGPGIFRHLLAETRGDHDLTSEALQQTYLRIARHARPVDSAPMFATWVRLVTRSALNDCRRRRRTFWDLLRNRDAATSENSDSSHADSPNEAALSSALETALTQLPAADRSLLEQKYFSGLDVRTLAVQLDLTPKAVESRLTRARAELRRLLVSALKRHE
ncbi:MAG: sigma-70 family RNA polymerase sigma factor [Verrucomicrobia bacterium]|nr:sigma-70 family RNA polymerase sigma factor [Verrucomicrobiota bacterium]